MRFVVDANVVSKLLVEERGSDKARELLVAGSEGVHELLAPGHMAQEVMNVVIRSRFKIEGELVRRSETWVLRRIDGLSDIMREDFIRITELDEEARRRAARLAHRNLPRGQGRLSVYDTAYHALARQTDAVFVTDDRSYIRKLGRMRGWTSSVIALGDMKI